MYQTLAHRTAYLITGDAGEAEDAAQEAFVKAFRALDRFREDSPFRPWMLSIVANEARNRRRSMGRRAGLELRLSEGHRGDAAPSPEAMTLAREPAQALLEALQELRDRDRTVIACRYLLELSEAETAAVLGCAKGTVKSRLARALARLRRRLESDRRAATMAEAPDG